MQDENLTPQRLVRLILLALTAATFLIPRMLSAHQSEKERVVRIGVLANRGENEAVKRWSETAAYLNRRISGHVFTVIPYDLDGIRSAVSDRKIAFVITNPSNYVELEHLHGLSRILTLRPFENKESFSVFGSVIFCRSTRKDIKSIPDLRGKSFMAVEERSFGGWQVAWRELTINGIDPYHDFASLKFTGFPQDKVVYAVRDGKADAGSVRTGLIEGMAREGKIDIKDFTILNFRQYKEFPFAVSTMLYPEWTMAKTSDTSEYLAREVAVVLLSMPRESPAAKAAKIEGWTIPLDYNSVHECLKDLKVSPYDKPDVISFSAYMKKYWYFAVMIIGSLLSVSAFSFVVTLYNRKMKGEISERKRAEKNITQQNKFMRNIIDSIANPFYVIDSSNYAVQFANRAVAPNGLPEMITCHELTHRSMTPCDDKNHPCVIEEVKSKKKPVIFEHAHFDGTGGRRMYEVHGYPVFDDTGSVTKVIEHSIDISERKNVEEQMMKLFHALEQSPAGVVIIDNEGAIEYVNSAFTDITGLAFGEVRSKSFVMVMSDRFPIESCNELWSRVKTGVKCHAELLGVRKNGDVYWEEISISPVKSLEGVTSNYVAIKKDITPRKEADKKLKDQQQELEDLNRTLEQRVVEEVVKNLKKDRVMFYQSHLAGLGQLAAGITHEINTPLTYIKGNIELLRSETLGCQLPRSQETSELFEAIEDGVKRISLIVESMKELSGYSNKEKKPANVYYTLVYANRVIHNRAKHIANIYINGSVFDLNLDRDREVFTAPISSQSIEQVWVVILNNALDELSKCNKPFEERYIDIKISGDNDKIHVVIRDNAGGIPPEFLDMIFDKFFSTKSHLGTGLGLHIAKTIVEGHGGTIQAYNEKSGAVFEITLPAN